MAFQNIPWVIPTSPYKEHRRKHVHLFDGTVRRTHNVINKLSALFQWEHSKDMYDWNSKCFIITTKSIFENFHLRLPPRSHVTAVVLVHQ